MPNFESPMLISSVFIQVIFLFSITDIYFSSPNCPVQRQHRGPLPAPAKRVVIFLADGLDASYQFDEHSGYEYFPWINRNMSPYLWSELMDNAQWGTATKYGHIISGYVQVMAGIREDPSVLLHFWKESPLQFDTVLNQSRQAWCWGRRDVLSAFVKAQSNIQVFDYMMNYSTPNQTMQQFFDRFLVSNVARFMNSSRKNSELLEFLHEDKLIFLLHLIQPEFKSKYLTDNIRSFTEYVQAVDFVIASVVNYMRKFFRDDERTLYLLTSDNDQLDDSGLNVAPIVVWGVGTERDRPPTRKVRTPVVINQSDLSVFMSLMLGIKFPKQNAGVVPSDLLQFDDVDLAQAYLTNLKQVSAHFEAWLLRFQNVVLYKPQIDITMDYINENLHEIQTSISHKNYMKAIESCKQLINILQETLEQYQRVYLEYLLTGVAVSIVFWILIICEDVISYSVLKKWHSMIETSYDESMTRILLGPIGIVCGFIYTRIDCFVFWTLICTVIILQMQSLPLIFFVYSLLPQALLYIILRRVDTWIMVIRMAFQSSLYQLMRYLSRFFHHSLLITLLIWTTYERRVWGALIMLMMEWGLWTHIHMPTYPIRVYWVFSGLVLVGCACLPEVSYSFQMSLMIMGRFLWISFGLYVVNISQVWKPQEFELRIKGQGFCLALFQLIILAISCFHTLLLSLWRPGGLLLVDQIFMYCLIAISSILTFFSPTFITKRFWHISLGLAVPYIYMSSSYEPLFLLAFIVHLYSWMEMEHYKFFKSDPFKKCGLGYYDQSKIHVYSYVEDDNPWQHPEPRMVGPKEFRIVVFALYLFLLGLLHAGNVTTFLVESHMVVMMKILIPVLITGCTIRGLHLLIYLSLQRTFYISTMYCNVIAFVLLFTVKSNGTWPDLRTSLLNYAFILMLPFGFVALHLITNLLTTIEGWEYESGEVSFELDSVKHQ